MTTTSLPEGVRRVGPADVPCVGEPPVPVRRVARAFERAKGDAAKVCVELSGLTEPDVEAARRLIELQPAELDPRPAIATLLGLAVPLGIGATFLAPAGWTLFGLACALFVTLPDGRGVGAVDVGRALLAFALGVGPGLALWRLSPIGRTAAVALALGAPLLFLLSGPGEALLAGFVGAPSLLLLTPPCRRWFAPDAARTLGGLSTRPYAVVACGLASLVTIGAMVIGRFRDIYASMGVELPWVTMHLLDLRDHIEESPFLVVPAVVLLPAPLLLVPHRHERTAFWATVTGVCLGAWLVFMGLTQPLDALRRALGQ